MEMAYLKAKSLDKGGRVTDADFRFARQMLAAGSDKATILQLLKDNIYRGIDNFNSNVGVSNREYKEEYPTVDSDEFFQKQDNESQSVQDQIDAIEAELNSMGAQ